MLAHVLTNSLRTVNPVGSVVSALTFHDAGGSRYTIASTNDRRKDELRLPNATEPDTLLRRICTTSKLIERSIPTANLAFGDFPIAA